MNVNELIVELQESVKDDPQVGEFTVHLSIDTASRGMNSKLDYVRILHLAQELRLNG